MSVEQFTGEIAFPQHKIMHNRIMDTLMEFEGQVPLASVLGVLDLVKHDLIRAVDSGEYEGDT